MKADARPEEPQYDDDFLTDGEQIKSSIDLINRDIEVVFEEYFKQKKDATKEKEEEEVQAKKAERKRKKR